MLFFQGMIAEPIPSWLQTVVDSVNALDGVFSKPANHVLLNEYAPGQGNSSVTQYRSIIVITRTS